MTITTIQDQLARDEGDSLTPYQDINGFWTIGRGHCFGTKDQSQIPPQFANGITQAQDDALFAADQAHEQALLDVYLPWWRSLPEVYAGVLQNMAFNLGTPGLCAFHQFLGLMQAGNWSGAAADLATTKVYQELPARYGRLCEQLRTGVWQ